jgi:hypothetical protein
MAETIVSPGAFTNEVDQSFLPAGVAAIGAAIIGPTQKGPAGIPIRVTSYADFLQKFGGAFTSGSGASEKSYKYLTNYAVQEYLKYADTMTVVRILAGNYSPASSSVNSSGGTSIAATASVNLSALGTASYNYSNGSAETNGIRIELANGALIGIFVSGSNSYFNTTTNQGTFTDGLGGLVSLINNTSELSAQLSASSATTTLQLTSSVAGTAGNGIKIYTGSLWQVYYDQPTAAVLGGTLGGGTEQSVAVFTLTTLSDGADQNSTSTEGTNGVLPSGSINNIRWEVTSRNTTKGTFNLIIRRGDDTNNRKTIVEQYNNLTLDPNSPNYIASVIGDQYYTLTDSGTTDPFLQLTGDYPNRSKYVRVTVHKNTINYLDANGSVRDSSLSYLIPAVSSGSFGGGSNGTVEHPILFNESISNTNTQGFNLGVGQAGRTSYIDAIRVLKNQDEYDINLLVLPGVVDNFTNHAAVLTEAVNMVESRGDCFLVIDPVEYGASITDATSQAGDRDSNYVAEYWPWVKVPDPDLGRNVWVPASTLIPGVYAFSDRVAAPWFAPAGLNRGGIDIAVSTERKLTQANRDTLYEASVNPIATFPNSGVVVYGQKTLQKKASALDRVNVRRLLIAAKKFIASTTKYLVFENNTAATRNRFLAITNPYFENVQQRQGLYAFKVVMDETNNTADVIDRNEMRGAIYLQPAKSAEFIIIDFNILPTGASFPE